jgi:hypothetical protein
MRRLALSLVLVALSGAAGAQEACAPLVGTYLTQKTFDAGADPNTVGRALLSLMTGGVAGWTDSNQGGSSGWQAFTEARGAWTCDGARFTARVLDFTQATPSMPAQQIARIDVEGTVEDDALAGRAVILFFPLGGDPFDTAAGANDIRYEFSGQRVTP